MSGLQFAVDAPGGGMSGLRFRCGKCLRILPRIAKQLDDGSDVFGKFIADTRIVHEMRRFPPNGRLCVVVVRVVRVQDVRCVGVDVNGIFGRDKPDVSGVFPVGTEPAAAKFTVRNRLANLFGPFAFRGILFRFTSINVTARKLEPPTSRVIRRQRPLEHQDAPGVAGLHCQAGGNRGGRQSRESADQSVLDVLHVGRQRHAKWKPHVYT